MKLIKSKMYGLTMKFERYSFQHRKEKWELETKAYLTTPGFGQKEAKGTMYTQNSIVQEMQLLKVVVVDGHKHYVIHTIKEVFPNKLNKFDKYLLTFTNAELIEASDVLQSDLPEIVNFISDMFFDEEE